MRRVALVMFNSAAHNKPSLIRGLLPRVMPHLYKETQIRKDLIREVGSRRLPTRSRSPVRVVPLRLCTAGGDGSVQTHGGRRLGRA